MNTYVQKEGLRFAVYAERNGHTRILSRYYSLQDALGDAN